MSQYLLYHNRVQYNIPNTILPNDDHEAIEVIKNIVKNQLHHIWKPEDRYVLASDIGDYFIYDNGFVYRMADSG